MKRMHVHVSVADVEQSVRFYASLFAAAPSVLKPDYARWMLEDPRVNFAISKRGASPGIEHLGIQVENETELAEVYDRLSRAERPILEEKATTCCYANSDKQWIADPQGVAWETFLTTGDATVYGRDGAVERLAAGSETVPRVGERSLVPMRHQGCGEVTAMARSFAVLFLCTGNSARSILAESLLNHWGKERFHGYSAGSFPTGHVHPMTIELLRSLRFPTDGLRSKSWDEFAREGAPVMDFVFTVCDQAAGEVCPVWPGQPVTAHWGVPDPAAVAGPEAQRMAAFRDTYRRLDARIKLFVALPFEKLDRMALKREVDMIGRLRPDAATAAAS